MGREEGFASEGKWYEQWQRERNVPEELGLGERPDLAAAENVMARHKDKVHNSQLCLFIWDSSSQSRMMTLYG